MGLVLAPKSLANSEKGILVEITGLKRMKKQIYQTHIWIAGISAIPLLLWCISAVMHPLMVWTSPEPAIKSIEQQVFPDRLQVSLAEALNRHELTRITSLGITQLGEKQYYRVGVEGSPHFTYLETETGELLTEGERLHAESLARKFSGDTASSVVSIEPITQFAGEYTSSGQFLPVMKVQLGRDDGMRAYVDLTGDRLATLIDNQRSWLLWIFKAFHTWEIPGMPEIVRAWGLAIFCFLVLIGAATGLIVYVVMWKNLGKGKGAATPRGRLRTVHRLAGVFVSLAMLIFAFSGMFHALVQGIKPDLKHLRPSDTFLASDLSLAIPDALKKANVTGPVQNISLAMLETGPHYLILRKPERRKQFPPVPVNATTGEVAVDGDLEQVRRIAKTYFTPESLKEAEVTRLTSFSMEYIPRNRRLPVVKVAKATGESIFIDPVDGAIAYSTSPVGRWESLSFSWLHKWRFLDQAGFSREVRDSIMVCFVTLGGMVSMTGGILLMYRNPLRKRRKAIQTIALESSEEVTTTSVEQHIEKIPETVQLRDA